MCDKRRRHVVGCGGDEDRIEGRVFRPALVAIADSCGDVLKAEPA